MVIGGAEKMGGLMKRLVVRLPFLVAACFAVAVAGGGAAVIGAVQHSHAVCAEGLAGVVAGVSAALLVGRVRDLDVDRRVKERMALCPEATAEEVADFLGLRPAVVRMSQRRLVSGR